MQGGLKMLSIRLDSIESWRLSFEKFSLIAWDLNLAKLIPWANSKLKEYDFDIVQT